MNRCPACLGPQLEADPRGPCAYQHGRCEIAAMHDVVIVSDHDRLMVEAGFTRPARQVERVLLTTQGHDVPADQTARVTRLSYSVHRTDFPGLAE